MMSCQQGDFLSHSCGNDAVALPARVQAQPEWKAAGYEYVNSRALVTNYSPPSPQCVLLPAHTHWIRRATRVGAAS